MCLDFGDYFAYKTLCPAGQIKCGRKIWLRKP